MDHNEAAAAPTKGEPDNALVFYCASLLQVNPAALLRYVLEARA